MSSARRPLMILAALVVLGSGVFAWPKLVAAISSNNYQIQEDFMGGLVGPNQTSGSYQSTQNTGGAATAPGDASSGGSYKSQSGGSTTNDPRLTFSVNTGSVNLGALSSALTRTGSATFSVLNYTSYGYLVQVIGSAPSNGTHTLTSPSSPATSAVGTEQFGINLVANSGLGADPQQVPDNTFSFGAAASGYSTANQYKYTAGNTIANAPKTSGQTNYTISYIANVSTHTPGGVYSGSQTLVCVGTY